MDRKKLENKLKVMPVEKALYEYILDLEERVEEMEQFVRGMKGHLGKERKDKVKKWLR